jgi:hypothetical protein
VAVQSKSVIERLTPKLLFDSSFLSEGVCLFDPTRFNCGALAPLAHSELEEKTSPRMAPGFHRLDPHVPQTPVGPPALRLEIIAGLFQMQPMTLMCISNGETASTHDRNDSDSHRAKFETRRIPQQRELVD